MKIGNFDIVDLRLGASQVSAWLGGEMVWGGSSPTPPAPVGDWLCFTAEQANSTVRLDKVGSPPPVSLEYSIDDGVTWNDYTWSGNTGYTVTLVNVDDKMYMRAKNENDHFADTENDRYTFNMTGLIAASGNI